MLNKEMTKEEIEKTAFAYACENQVAACTGGELEKGFIAGAEWRINSVWHDASERPDERRGVIIEYGENRISLHEKGYDGPWKYNVEQFGFKRWAYIKDLIPNNY